MSEKTVLIILCTVSIAFNIFLSISYRIANNQLEGRQMEEFSDESDYNPYKSSFKHCISYEGSEIDPTVELESPDGEVITLSNIAGNHTLFFFYSDYSCQPCIDITKELLPQDSLQLSKLSLIISYHNKRKFLQEVQILPQGLNVYFLKNKPDVFPFFPDVTEACFQIGYDFCIHNFYYPNKYHPELSSFYFENYYRRYNL